MELWRAMIFGGRSAQSLPVLIPLPLAGEGGVRVFEAKLRALPAAARPLTQLRLSSLALAKTSYPSPTRGEGLPDVAPCLNQA